MIDIKDYGWNEYFDEEWKVQPGLAFHGADCPPMRPARIIADYGQLLRVVADTGEQLVSRPLKNTGRDMHGRIVDDTDEQLKMHVREVEGVNDQLAVGDWVALGCLEGNKSAYVYSVLARKTKFSRSAAGPELKEQIVASNVDTAFLMQSLNRDFNMKRLERYLVAAWESGAMPVVVLSKADCCDDVGDKLAKVYNTAPGVEVHVISCVTGEGIEDIKKYFTQGKTVALLGSSGVGKSTLVNTLAGKELLKTQDIREDDDKGRHTTTHRELLLLPGGGLILDTPGMRSLSLWESDTGMEVMFGDVEELVRLCRFSDCQHRREPGCAVRAALNSGKLDKKRWESWQKLQKELAHLDAKRDGKQRMLEKQFGKQIAKFQKEFYKERL